MTAPGTKFIHADTFGNIFAGSRLIVVVMLFFVSFYRLDNTFARSRFRTIVYQLGVAGFLQVFFLLFAAFLTTGVTICQIVNTAAGRGASEKGIVLDDTKEALTKATKESVNLALATFRSLAD